jgi:hypothetical protein
MHKKLLLLLSVAGSAFGAGLDRDGVLTEAPATPEAGTVRVAGAGNSSYVAGGGGVGGGISGTVQWSIFHHFAADVGAYYQDGAVGPSVRVRYQFLSQEAQGVDFAAGLRYKSVGLDPANGEVEGLLAVGRSFGHLDLILDLVAGHELGGPGFDVEAKALIGYRIIEQVRVGLDFRGQAEVHDENGWKSPDVGTDMALVGGAAVSWMPMEKLQFQLLAGATKPRGFILAGPVAFLTASWDF